jgi:hypothetical protein
MANAAEYGLMLWDGKSKGTINNIVNLSRYHKLVVVYVAPKRLSLPSRYSTTSRLFSPRAILTTLADSSASCTWTFNRIVRLAEARSRPAQKA